MPHVGIIDFIVHLRSDVAVSSHSLIVFQKFMGNMYCQLKVTPIRCLSPQTLYILLPYTGWNTTLKHLWIHDHLYRITHFVCNGLDSSWCMITEPIEEVCACYYIKLTCPQVLMSPNFEFCRTEVWLFSSMWLSKTCVYFRHIYNMKSILLVWKWYIRQMRTIKESKNSVFSMSVMIALICMFGFLQLIVESVELLRSKIMWKQQAIALETLCCINFRRKGKTISVN